MGCDLSFINKTKSNLLRGENPLYDKKVLLLGLDGAGKTSLLLQYKDNQFTNTVPTIGLNVEQIKFRKYLITMWDVGGQATKLWKHYFDHIDAIIYVVDSTCDDKRLEKNKNELGKLGKDPSLQGVPLLVMLNKQDMQHREDDQIVNLIQLEDLKRFPGQKKSDKLRQILIQPCSAKTGDGIWEAMGNLAFLFEEQ